MDPRQRYFWTPADSRTIDDYVKQLTTKVKPSIITDRDAPGGKEREEDPEAIKTQGAAIVEAKDLSCEGNVDNQVIELQMHIDWAQQHTGFAKRATNGAETKTSYVKKVHDEATEKLKKVSKKHKWTVGKWLLFPKHADINRVWSQLARSVACGPLRDAGVFLAKVAPTPASSSSGTEYLTHVICLYLRDIYDLPTGRKVLQVLLKEHGLEPSAAKSDLYTLVGIDSHHPTKLRSSIWRVFEVLEGGKDEVQELKSQYKPKSSARSGSDAPRKQTFSADGIIGSDSEDEQISRSNKHPSGAKTKREDKEANSPGNDPADEVELAPKVKKRKTPARKTKAQMYQDNDIFATDSD